MVAGPLLGGYFVDNLTWRWIFYVNLPLGLIAMFVLAATLPSRRSDSRPTVDYIGAGLLAAGLSCIVVVTSLGGTTWDWTSPELVVTAVAGVLLVAVFLRFERRVAEPVLPPRLFRQRTFAVSSVVSLIVGFALFGAITFLPLFFQKVNGDGPTESGLRLVPMMLGVLTTSIASGQLISRIGRYKVFPVVGTAVMVVGFLLLSGMDPQTSTVSSSLRLLVLGLGLGLTMQVLVLAVQNAVAYDELGVATSGVTLFRTIGGAVGTSVFGTIFSNRLAAELGDRTPFLTSYTDALSTVFVAAAGIAALGFVLIWLLPEAELRDTVAAAEPFTAPRSADSLAEIERAIWVLANRDTKRRIYTMLAERVDAGLPPLALWTLGRLNAEPGVGIDELTLRSGVPRERVAETFALHRERGLIEADLRVTDAGREVIEKVVLVRREGLERYLDGWAPDEHPDLTELLDRVSRDLPPASDRAAAPA
jgi:predicted MFS family arabinose efflux permease